MDFPVNAPVLSRAQQKGLSKEINGFIRACKLKELISKKANGDYNNKSLNFWLINKWGGIENFKPTIKNNLKIDKFEREIIKRKLSKHTFETISSLSKIASFIDPDNYVIYDSRVIYAINWLILITQTKCLKFFPMPSGRNRILVDIDLSTIIRLVHKDNLLLLNAIFYTHQEAYFKFCDLVKELSKKVYGQECPPYKLEMLLYAISNKEIHQELIELTKIQLDYA